MSLDSPIPRKRLTLPSFGRAVFQDILVSDRHLSVSVQVVWNQILNSTAPDRYKGETTAPRGIIRQQRACP